MVYEQKPCRVTNKLRSSGVRGVCMTDKEFKRLRRSDLISIIYEYQRQQDELNKEIEQLRARLEERELKIKEAGSIAQAVVGLNELFETAQKTADEYLEQVRILSENAEKRAEEIVAEAEARAKQTAAEGETSGAE